MEEYLSLEFLFVILSVIFVLALPGILIKLAKRSKVGFMISIGVVCIIIISIVVVFTISYNARYSLEGQNYIYGRITNLTSNHSFTVNSTKGTYKSGSIGNIKVIIDKNTSVYDVNYFKNIKTVKEGEFVTVVCTDQEINDGVVHAIKVIRDH